MTLCKAVSPTEKKSSSFVTPGEGSVSHPVQPTNVATNIPSNIDL